MSSVIDADVSAAQSPQAAPRTPRARVLSARPSTGGLVSAASNVLAASLFGLFTAARVQGLSAMLRSEPAGDQWLGPLQLWLSVGHGVLGTLFLGLLAGLFVLRRSPRRARPNLIGDAAAIGGTLGLMPIAGAPRTTDSVVILLLADALLLVGMAVAVIGLMSLGRCFGVMPRARGLVRTGLYRYVRHPVYLGEFIAALGSVLVVLSPFSAGMFAVFAALQVYRLGQEEATLAAAFPEYQAYRATTWRLLPGLY